MSTDEDRDKDDPRMLDDGPSPEVPTTASEERATTEDDGIEFAKKAGVFALLGLGAAGVMAKAAKANPVLVTCYACCQGACSSGQLFYTCTTGTPCNDWWQQCYADHGSPWQWFQPSC
jgi:hypothetical protein